MSGDYGYPGRCPCCNARQLRKRKTIDRIYCYNCGAGGMSAETVAAYQLIPPPGKGRVFNRSEVYRRAPRSSGGKIAGAITIGRGSKWGAGLV